MGMGGIEYWRLKNETARLDPNGTYTAGIDVTPENADLLRNILASLQNGPAIPQMNMSGGIPFAPIGSGNTPPPQAQRSPRMPMYQQAPSGPMSQLAYQMAAPGQPMNPFDILRTIQPAPRSP